MKRRRIIQKTSAITTIRRETHEAAVRPLDAALIRRLFAFARPHARIRLIVFVAVIVRSIQLPILAAIIGAILGRLSQATTVTHLLIGAAAYLLFSLFTQLVFMYRIRYALIFGESVLHDLRRDMFRQLQRFPLQYFLDTRIGRLISRFTTDAEAIRMGVQDVLFVSLVQLGQMIVAAAVMAWCDWVLFLLIAAIAPFLWWQNYYFHRRLSTVHRAVQESFSRITATLAESVNGIRVTQGFARERINAGLFGELAADHATFNLDVAKASGLFIPLLEFNNQLFIACLLLAGGWRVLHGHTAIADLYQFIMMSGLFFQGIVGIGTQYNNALSSMAGAERVFRLLDSRPGWEDPPDAAPAVLSGRVEFRNVSFAYVADRPVLRHVSFTAEPGQTVALVGHTGSGKTTIINLVAKFFLPTCGDLLLDGRDIRTVTSESIHRQTALVLQQNFLFTGTVMENIRLGRAGATDAEVTASLRRLRCLDLIEALPNGLQTPVGEKGAGISLGQRQIICFARAMLVDPAILILDEATSAIDTVTERRIQDALAILLRGRTSFVVAHRLSTVRNADHVLVLERGAIIERGTHDTLLARNGVYANLYRQFVRTNSQSPGS